MIQLKPTDIDVLCNLRPHLLPLGGVRVTDNWQYLMGSELVCRRLTAGLSPDNVSCANKGVGSSTTNEACSSADSYWCDLPLAPRTRTFISVRLSMEC